MDVRELPVLDRRHALIHIGLPKTGTSVVQNAARVNRPLFKQIRVCYPGKKFNHFGPANDLMGRGRPSPKFAPGERWGRLVREVRRRKGSAAWISYEQLVLARPADVARIQDDLQRELRVVITARSFVSLHSSAWQQWIKDGGHIGFEEWCDLMLSSAEHDDLSSVRRQYDLVGATATWAEVVGAQNVTVTMVDKRSERVVFDVFEHMLGIPDGTLSGTPVPAAARNRSLTAVEAALALAVNQALKDSGREPDRAYVDIVKRGAWQYVLERRDIPPGEPAIEMPRAAGLSFAAAGARAAKALAQGGVTVVGAVSQLGDPPPVAGAIDPVTHVPGSLVRDVLLGMQSRAPAAVAKPSEPGAEGESVAIADAAALVADTFRAIVAS